MEADLNTSTDFYFLNQKFEVIHKLTQYESLMWVDKYDEPGSFEIYAPPIAEIREAAAINNYFISSKSEHVMIVEKLETTVSPENGMRLIISGRSLESILDRRVIFKQCYMRDKNSPSTPTTSSDIGADNLEDAVRQVLDICFMHPMHYDSTQTQFIEDPNRKVDNFTFLYSNQDAVLVDNFGRTIWDENYDPVELDSLNVDGIDEIVLKDCEFDKGETALNIINTIVNQAGLGYKITLDENNNFVFRLIKGKDRTTGQSRNPAVVFSPRFNNLKSSKFTEDHGENFRNYVYTEGEIYKSLKPTIVETGDVTGLLRREVYCSSDVTHETETSNVNHETGITNVKKTLTESEYQEALKEDAQKQFDHYAAKTELESEVEPRLSFQYGRDFGIGDILEVQDGTGNSGKVRCVEFIISHSSSGYEEYPTFENYKDPEDDEPTQTTASGGEYSDGGGGKVTQDNMVSAALGGAIRFGTEGSTTKIKVKINSTIAWMLAFTVHLYQGYKEISVRVSGYNYATNHWHNPEARVISDSDNDNTPFYVYFGYDSDWNLWVGFDGGNYTGITISDVVNGYQQIGDYSKLFTITNETSLTTIQTTLYAIKIPSHIGEIIQSTKLSSLDLVRQLYGSATNWKQHSGYMLRGATSGVSFNKTSGNMWDGGNDNASVIYHNHGFTGTAHNSGTVSADHTHWYSAATGPYNVPAGSYYGLATVTGAYTGGITANHVHSSTSTGTVGYNGVAGTNLNLPKYKNIYIWERIT